MAEPSKRTSSGTFAVAPLLNLLLLALDRKLSGTLVLETLGGGKTLITLSDGSVSNLRPAGPVVRLGELLVELAGVHETTVELAASTKSGPRLLGQKLVDAGVIDQATLETALREQLMRRVLWAGRLPATTQFHYFEDANMLKDWGNGAITVDPLTLLWQYIKINATNQEVDSALERLGTRELKLHSRARVQRFLFGSKIQGALDVLRVRPQSTEALLAARLLDSDTLKRALYALAVTRHLDLGREDLEPMGVAAPQSKYPAPSTERRVRRRFEPSRPRQDSAPQEAPKVSVGVLDELQALKEKLDLLNYYELLGVSADSSIMTINGAFLSQAKKWHPDKWRAEQGTAQDDAARIFARISEAHQVLTNDEQRKEYDRLSKNKGQEAEEQETVRQVLRAAGLFQKAQVLAKKNDFATAEDAARAAYEGDPSQAEYGAFYAWLVAQNPQHKEKNFDELISILDRAIAEEKNSIQIHYYRAVVLKRAGRINEAMKDFRFVNDQDPNNVEAARELRLNRMRVEETKSAARKGETLLNKLFKK